MSEHIPVMNSTAGKIGKGKTFFEEAFGRNLDEFHTILWMPEAFIIQRFKYKDNSTAEWRRQFNALNTEQRAAAKKIIATNDFSPIGTVTDKQIQEVLQFYLTKRK